MKRWIGILIAAIAVLCTFCPMAFSADRFTITRVYDGDTVRAESGQVVVYIMLVGIDAPEVADEVHKKGQPFGKEARDFLAEEVLNRSVEVEGYGVAPYPHDNIIGVIRLGKKNINLEMVKKGLAEVQRDNLPKGLDIVPYLDAERDAKAGKLGMWVLGDQYMSPKTWRLKYMSHFAGTEGK
ncbi:MAG: thermonuclease family protein [Desulfatiglandaceae bacterium]|jgi:endonuclease YncB( thermonuclease family)